MSLTRRKLLGSMTALVGLQLASGSASADHDETVPAGVTIEYDETLIKEYYPRFVLEDVEPEALFYHGLHATSENSTMNAVYGFVSYPFQEGQTSRDSHLGDHEPIIVFYDKYDGSVARVDYTPVHWFHEVALPEQLQFADTARHRPVMRVHPEYHHYQVYSGANAGTDLQVRNLAEDISGWLDSGLESELAPSQPFDPWEMIGRESWWAHTAGNWLDATFKALWFNLGLSDRADAADVDEVSAW